MNASAVTVFGDYLLLILKLRETFAPVITINENFHLSPPAGVVSDKEGATRKERVILGLKMASAEET